MNILVKCADCGRTITNQVILGMNKNVDIDIHACHHGLLYGKKCEQALKGRPECTEEKE